MLKIKSNSGMTLVEVMVAGVIASIISLALATTMTNMFKAQKNVESAQEILFANQQLQNAMATTCSMIGSTYDPTAMAANPAVSLGNINLGTGVINVQSNTAIPNSSIRIATVKMQNMADGAIVSGKQSHNAMIRISYEKTGQILGPKTTREYQIPMFINRNVSTNVVTDCSPSNSVSPAQILETSCTQAGGTWDAPTNTCTMPNYNQTACTQVGGTWTGSTCNMPNYNQSACTQAGGTWTGSTCNMPDYVQMACTQAGGTYNAGTSTCDLSSLAQKSCTDMGGTWNAGTKTCTPPNYVQMSCVQSGGTYNAGTNHCDLPTADLADAAAEACKQSGGTYNPALPDGERCELNKKCEQYGSYGAGSTSASYNNPLTGAKNCPAGSTAYATGSAATPKSCGKDCVTADYSQVYTCMKCGSNAITAPPPPCGGTCEAYEYCDYYTNTCQTFDFYGPYF